MKQCKACPWKVTTDPERDIPGGYSAAKHRSLSCTIAHSTPKSSLPSSVVPSKTSST